MPVMHTYVEARLGRWGLYQRWLRRGGSYPGPKRVISWFGPMVLDPHIEGQDKGAIVRSPDPCPVDAEEAQETMRCVAILGQHQRMIIVELYVCCRRPVDIQKDFRYCKWRYYNELCTAYADLLGYFNDVAAGLPLPAIETQLPAKCA